MKTGVDAMANKEVMKHLICESYKKRNLISSDCAQQKTVSRQARSIKEKCSMTLTIFLGLDNHFYLSKNSCLDHCYHPRQQSESILCGQKDMASGDFDLLTLLCSVNVSPMQICQIMDEVQADWACGSSAHRQTDSQIFSVLYSPMMKYVSMFVHIVM